MNYFNGFLAFFISSIFSFSAFAAGPTYVKDAIATSATWTKEDSPYILQNDIVVSKSAVLTIAPGTEIRFVAPTGGAVGASPNLVIQGGLRAVGSPTAPIQFNPAVAGSLWGAIYFYNADSANCILEAVSYTHLRAH